MLDETLTSIIGFLIAGYVAFMVLKNPYLGIVFTVATLPILDLLPSIPVFSSVVSILGGVTVIGFLLQSRSEKTRGSPSSWVIFILGIVFILWMFFSNPAAAWSGKDRNWFFTFVQLWVLMFLSSRLLDTRQKQVTLMWIFALVATFSAFYAIQRGYIGESIDVSIRARGFVDNANAAARYFIVAMVFFTYLRSQYSQPAIKFLILLGIIVTYIGVFFTLSRSGIVLLFAAQALIFISQASGKQRLSILFLSVFGLILIWVISENALKLTSTIIPAVTAGEDTIGLRYALWQAAFRMLTEKPITGVGIGEYRFLVPYYSMDLPFIRGRSIWAHNTYIQILVETGVVGFILFMGMFLGSWINFLKARFPREHEFAPLVKYWFIVFSVMLLGGLTKSDHADKLTWMVMGISIFFDAKHRSFLRDSLKQASVNGFRKQDNKSNVPSEPKE